MSTLAEAKKYHEVQESNRHSVRKLLKPDAVAHRLDVPLSTVYEAARQDRIGGLVRFGRKVRFDPDKFEAWLEAGGEALPGGWRQEPDAQ